MFLSSDRKTNLWTMSSADSCPNNRVFSWPAGSSGSSDMYMLRCANSVTLSQGWWFQGNGMLNDSLLTVHVDQEEVSNGPLLQQTQFTLLAKHFRAASGRQVQCITVQKTNDGKRELERESNLNDSGVSSSPVKWTTFEAVTAWRIASNREGENPPEQSVPRPTYWTDHAAPMYQI